MRRLFDWFFKDTLTDKLLSANFWFTDFFRQLFKFFFVKSNLYFMISFHNSTSFRCWHRPTWLYFGINICCLLIHITWILIEVTSDGVTDTLLYRNTVTPSPIFMFLRHLHKPISSVVPYLFSVEFHTLWMNPWENPYSLLEEFAVPFLLALMII